MNYYRAVDLTNLGRIDALLVDSFRHITSAASITLINNAGVVDRTGPIETVSPGEIAKNIQINLTAVMVLRRQGRS